MRRLFWVSVGAGLGISGYRRASRVLRELSVQPPSRRLRLRPSLRQVRGVTGFVRDVREGMDLYAERQRLGAGPHQAQEAPTLGWQHDNGAGAAHGASHHEAGHHGAGSQAASHNGASAH
jgi:hypothetical protein